MESSAGPVLEQVPKYELRVVDDGLVEKVELSVKLPGVTSAAEITVKCTSGSSSSISGGGGNISSLGSISVWVPGRYNLLLPLSVNIFERADSVKFNRKKESLKIVCQVMSRTAAATAANGSNSSGSSNGFNQPQGTSHFSSSSTPSTSSTAVHESFYPQPTKAERKKQQEQAAAAAAAEAERREQQEREAAAAAAAALAAAEEEQRRQQQQQANREAAEAWLARGIEAAQQNNITLASKALKKINELDSGVDITPLRQALVKLRQQQQQQQQPGNGSDSKSSNQERQQSSSSQSSGTTNSSSNGNYNQQQQQQQQRSGSTTGSSSSSRGPGGTRRGQPPPRRGPSPAGAAAGSSSFGTEYSTQDHSSDTAADAAAASAAGSSGGLVDWWCFQYERLSALWVDKAEQLFKYCMTPGRGRVAHYCSYSLAVLLLGIHVALMWCWRKGWMQPLYVIAHIRQVGGDSYAESRFWLNSTFSILLQHTLTAAAAKLCLLGLSCSAVGLLLWLLLLRPLGGHSIVGWCFALVIGIWTALVLHPWHILLLPLAIFMFAVDMEGSGGAIGIWALQMLLLSSTSSGGGWVNLSAWAMTWVLYLGLLPRIKPTHWAAATAASFVLSYIFSASLSLACPDSWPGLAGLSLSSGPRSMGGRLLLAVEWLAFAWAVLVRVEANGSMWERGTWTSNSSGSSSGGNSSNRGSHQQSSRGGEQASTADDDEEEVSFDPSDGKFVNGFGSMVVPEGCEVDAVRQVLLAKNYYQVMGFTGCDRSEVTADSLKVARRKVALAVHPDKVGHEYPGANQAASRVNQAFEVLSNDAQRKVYNQLLDIHSQPRQPRSSSGSGMGGTNLNRTSSSTDYNYAPPYKDNLYDIDDNPFCMSDMYCPHCDRMHTIHLLTRAPFGVRWCRECACWHDTKPKEVWAHWSPSLGGLTGRSRILFAANEKTPIYDITAMFTCSGKLSMDYKKCNSHFNPIGEVMTTGASGGSKGSKKSQRAQQQQQRASAKKNRGRRR